MTLWLRTLIAASALLLLLDASALAQRRLYWDAVDVTARLDAAGRLHVDEVQTMIFTGDWNGGERRFNIRPRQELRFVGLYREVNGGWEPLREDSYVDDVDEYAWADATTLRWRSRAPDDAEFAGTTLRYLIRYELSNILLDQDGRYVLDHDFLFPERDDVVGRFDLRLDLDPAWQPLTPPQPTYSARNVPPGDGFVVTVPMQFVGAGTPATLDTSRPVEVRVAVQLLLVVTVITVLWVIGREWTRGRFASVERGVDEAWLQEHLLRHPAEVVGAAWDEVIGSPEVVALIARMTSEGKLASEVAKGGGMRLRLLADRETLQGHERTLVDKLFFDNRTVTNTQLLKQHYRKSGLDPGLEITPELQAAVAAATPEGKRPRPLRFVTPVLFLAGMLFMGLEWFRGPFPNGLFVFVTVGSCVLALLALWIGTTFRWNIEWSFGRALLCLVPAVAPILLAAWFLWERVGLDLVEASTNAVWGIALLALWILAVGANAMVSRQFAAGIAFRKRLAAARAFFATELRAERPQLRDEWQPWLLALGLTKEMDAWSVQHAGSHRAHRSSGIQSSTITSSSSSSSDGGSSGWTGFGGGRSGGAGGGAAWTTAASGLAAGVSPPSSSGSSSGGSSSSSSSSGGSSGGGGGGGW